MGHGWGHGEREGGRANVLKPRMDGRGGVKC